MGLLVSVVAAIFSCAAWMLIFIHFAVVPDGTAYPDGWPTLTSAEQVEWLRTHIMVLSGFDGSVYMLKHFSKYSAQLTAMFTMTWVSAALAIGAWWHLTREHFQQTDGGDDATSLARFRNPVSEKDR